MKSSLIYASLAVQFGFSTAYHGQQMKPRQEDDFEFEAASEYIWRMCYPGSFGHFTSLDNVGGQIFPYLANSSAPCDQRDYIIGSCIANSTTPAIDFAAEQQCLCGSNLVDAWNGCDACYYAHGVRYTDGEEESEYISSALSAECAPSPYPSVPFFNLLNITIATTTSPPLVLVDDKFPNQTAASNYWTTSAHLTATIGIVTGSATARASERTNSWEFYTPSESLVSASGTAVITSSPTTTPIPTSSGSGSAAGTSASLSTGGAGDYGVAGGVVFIVVNVVAVMLL